MRELEKHLRGVGGSRSFLLPSFEVKKGGRSNPKKDEARRGASVSTPSRVGCLKLLGAIEKNKRNEAVAIQNFKRVLSQMDSHVADIETLVDTAVQSSENIVKEILGVVSPVSRTLAVLGKVRGARNKLRRVVSDMESARDTHDIFQGISSVVSDFKVMFTSRGKVTRHMKALTALQGDALKFLNLKFKHRQRIINLTAEYNRSGCAARQTSRGRVGLRY